MNAQFTSLVTSCSLANRWRSICKFKSNGLKFLEQSFHNSRPGHQGTILLNKRNVRTRSNTPNLLCISELVP